MHPFETLETGRDHEGVVRGQIFYVGKCWYTASSHLRKSKTEQDNEATLRKVEPP